MVIKKLDKIFSDLMSLDVLVIIIPVNLFIVIPLALILGNVLNISVAYILFPMILIVSLGISVIMARRRSKNPYGEPQKGLLENVFYGTIASFRIDHVSRSTATEKSN